MTPAKAAGNGNVAQRLAEAEAIIEALLSGQIDAVVDSKSNTPVLLSKAQDALRTSEERYRRIVETANEGIWTIDENSCTTFVNGQMARMLGYTVQELIGMPLAALVGDKAKTARSIEKNRQGLSQRVRSILLRKDGSTLSVRVSSAPKFDSGGKFLGTLAMITDRTEQEASEEALFRSEAQYRQIVETTTDGIITVDPDGLILFVNGRLAEMLGYKASEMIGKSWLTFMTAAAQGMGIEMLKQRADGLRDASDSTLRHQDGSEIMVHIAGTPIFDVDGRHTGSMGVVRDVTERRKLQSQLMVSDRMASVGTLAAGVAHEINNPLAALMANLDYIAESLAQLTGERVSMDRVSRDAWIRDEIKPPLDDAREAADRVRFIVRDLKMFSRSPSEEAGGPVNVMAVMESSLRMAWNEIRHRARLVKNYGRIPDVEANEARLGQVFLNLIVNAAQAMPEGAAETNEIRVTTSLQDERVLIEVSDTGPGIPPEIGNRVFDAFFTTKAIGEGTGLGLAICHRIVTDLGGQLTLDSKMGVGTTFCVSLPPARKEAVEVVTATPKPLVAGRRGRILLVDDEVMVIRILTRILASENEVIATVDAREALARCVSGEKFDLILCDLM
ncbi:MAG: PAS domain S-box protein, partial [Gemmatimonadales bacterium]